MADDGKELVECVVGVDGDCFAVKLGVVDRFGGEEVAEV